MIIYRKASKYFYFILVACSLLIFFYFGLFDLIFAYLIAPIQGNVSDASNTINRVVLNRKQDKNIEVRYKLLQDKYSNLLQDVARLKLLEQENEIFRENLEFFEERLVDKKFVTSRIIGKSLDNSAVVFIDKGSNDGILENLPVIASKGIMIGKVVSVSLRRSKVVLASDETSLIAGTILNNEKTTNLVSGKFGLSLEIELIPQNEKVVENDIVITSGLEENIPRGLLIGEVREVRSSLNSLFQSAIVQPAVSYTTLSIVSVLLPD